MKKIYIDPGHGGDSIGATYKGRLEQDDCLRLCLAVRDLLLTQKGVEVKLSREGNTNPDIALRCREANEWGADYFLSIHRNAFIPNRADGVEAWVYSGVSDKGETFLMAKRLVEDICKSVAYKNRGVKKGAPSYADFGVNSLTKMSSCLLEVGFIDSDKDNRIFDSRFQQMAETLSSALLENVGLTYKRPIIKGDADGDGKITSADARLILRASVGLETVDTERADVDGDGKITSADAREVLRRSVGEEDENGK